MRRRTHDVRKDTRLASGKYEWDMMGKDITWQYYRRAGNVKAMGCLTQSELHGEADVLREAIRMRKWEVIEVQLMRCRAVCNQENHN